MIKVHILDRCKHSDGQAYLPIGEAESYTGKQYLKCKLCPQCQVSGMQARRV